MRRNILYLNIPSFPIAVERVARPGLSGRAVILAYARSARSTAQCVSPEAQGCGVRKGTPLDLALKYCPSAVIIPPNEPLYRRASSAILEILKNLSPLIEPMGPGRFFIDMTGTKKLFGEARDSGSRLRVEIRERLRLSATVGVASNKLVSKIAANAARPQGLCDVFYGREASFIAPFHVGLLPGVGEIRKRLLLEELNIKTIGHVAKIRAEALGSLFGKAGTTLKQSALGIDHSPVRPPAGKPFIVEEITLQVDSNDDDLLRSLLYHLVERGGRRLRGIGLSPGLILLFIKYSDHVNSKARVKLRRGVNFDMELFHVAAPLLQKACSRRTRVKHMALEFHELAKRPTQGLLFPCGGLSSKEEALVKAMDIIRDKYGEKAVGRAGLS